MSSSPIAIDGHSIEPADVLRRIIRNLKPKRGRPLWSAVHEATAHGSTVSMGLCRWAGVDPDTGDRIVEQATPTPNPVDSRAEFEAAFSANESGGGLKEFCWRLWQKQAARAGAGWRWVPIDPTPEMIKAAPRNAAIGVGGMTLRASPQEMWSAMLAAAPEPATRPVQAVGRQEALNALDSLQNYHSRDSIAWEQCETVRAALATPQQQAPVEVKP